MNNLEEILNDLNKEDEREEKKKPIPEANIKNLKHLTCFFLLYVTFPFALVTYVMYWLTANLFFFGSSPIELIKHTAISMTIPIIIVLITYVHYIALSYRE